MELRWSVPPNNLPLLGAASSERELQRRYWRLAALLFFSGGLAAIAADALHRPAHEPTVYLLPALALATGVVCWVIADRASLRWLPALVALATLEIALTVWLVSQVFAFYYIMIAFYAAYVFRSRRQVALQFALASVCVLLPVAYDPEGARETVITAVVLIPTLLLTAGVMVHLRERLEASEERYRRLAESDPLTGVGNYRMLSEKLPEELDRHRRYQRRLALVVVDLDNFKWVNDELGHQRGDAVLRDVARALAGSVRASDVVVRHGGDEFCVIAPETSRASAEDLGMRLRRGLLAVRADGRAVGASIGCAVFPDDGDDVNSLLARADDRLRESKEARPGLSSSLA